MSDLSLLEIEHRLQQAEKNIKELFGKVNGVDKSLVATSLIFSFVKINTSLD